MFYQVAYSNFKLNTVHPPAKFGKGEDWRVPTKALLKLPTEFIISPFIAHGKNLQCYISIKTRLLNYLA